LAVCNAQSKIDGKNFYNLSLGPLPTTRRRGSSVDQLDLQALHRVRERFVGQRTGIINQIRAFM
jgi:hypothetical protein